MNKDESSTSLRRRFSFYDGLYQDKCKNFICQNLFLNKNKDVIFTRFLHLRNAHEFSSG